MWLLRGTAAAYLGERVRTLTGDSQLERVAQVTAMIEGLRSIHEDELARRVASTAKAELAADALATPLAEAAEEFEAARPSSLQELTNKVAQRIEKFDLAERRMGELAALAGGAIDPEISALFSSSRMSTARTLRRRAGGLMAQSRAKDLGALPGEVAPLAELDRQLSELSPGAGKLRLELVRARAAGLLRRELLATTTLRPADALEFLREAERRLRTLEVDPPAVLRALRPAVGHRLQTWIAARPAPAPPPGPYAEEGYLQLIAQSAASADRAAVSEISRLVGADADQEITAIRARLEELDLGEVAAQVLYLESWFAQVAASVPAPGDLASLPQAESAWAVVSASRFFRQAWRDQELVTLRERLRELTQLPAVGAGAQDVGRRLDELLRKSELFGRALLDRRAALASAA